MYPKYGPGKMWEEVCADSKREGADLHLGQKVIGIESFGNKVLAVKIKDETSGNIKTVCSRLFLLNNACAGPDQGIR